MLSDFTYTIIGNVINGVITNVCNQELDFTIADYEVGILDMLFLPGSWDNVRDGANNFTMQIMKDQVAIGDPIKLSIPPKQYTTSELISTVTNIIDAQWGPDHSRYAWIKMCKELSYLYGLSTILIDHPPNYLIVPSDRIPITTEYIKPWEKTDGRRNNLSMLWLFADFIANTIIGNTQAPLLRFIPIKAGSGTMEHSTFSQHHYVRVKRRKISIFQIFVCDTILQRPLHFWNQWTPITITLHFRIRTR